MSSMGKGGAAQKVSRKRSWLFEIIVCAEVLALYAIWYAVTRDAFAAAMAFLLTYYPLAWGLRLTLQHHHRAGRKHLRAQEYEQALACFKKSEAFFTRYPWIDRLRVVTMFNTSAYSYLEMALQNQAYALMHLDRVEESAASLERLLAAAPGREDVREMLDTVRRYTELSQSEEYHVGPDDTVL